MKSIQELFIREGYFEGCIARMKGGLDPRTVQWDQVLRFILAALVSLGVAYGIGLTGGLITVIAVLFMPMLPHSPRLAIFRAVTAIIGFGFGWLLSYQFVDQPWLLLLVLSANAYFWFYMMASGFPFLSMMVLGLMPLLVAWMVYAGKPPEMVSTSIAQFLCGVFGSEFIAMVWPNTAAMRLRKQSAGALRTFASQIHAGFGSDLVEQKTLGSTDWDPTISLSFNNLLMSAREELGVRSREFIRLSGLVENIRHIAAWPRIYHLFITGGRFDKWMIDLLDERTVLHGEIYKSTEEIARAIEESRPAEQQVGLEKAFQDLWDKSDKWMEDNLENLSTETIAFMHTRVRYSRASMYRLNEIIKFTRQEAVDEESRQDDLPRVSMTDIAHGFNPKSGVFALKSLICVLIGFAIASIYPNWDGSLVLLLMSGFLAPLTLGALGIMFFDRIWGLVMAVIVAFLAITLVMPNITAVGNLLVLVGVVLLPGAILALKPATASMGLSYAMALLFILTSAEQPSVSLEPIQERFVSVGGATLICFMVFMIILPNTAPDLLSSRLKQALGSIADLLASSKLVDQDPVDRNTEIIRLRHASVRSCGEFDQFVRDFYWESDSPERLQRYQHRMVDLLHSNLLLAGNASVLSCERRIDDSTLVESMNDTMSSLATAQQELSIMSMVEGEYKDIKKAFDVVREKLVIEKQAIEQAKVSEGTRLGRPEREESIYMLAEYALHLILFRYQQRIHRCQVMRDLLHERVGLQYIGRTA